MKRELKPEAKDSKAIKLIVRRLFEVQTELERLNNQTHDYERTFERIIDSIDDLIDQVMRE